MEHWLGTTENKPPERRDNTFRNACIAYFVAMVLFVCLRVASGLGWFGLLVETVCGSNACDHMTCIGAQVTDIVASVLIQIVIFLVVPLVIFKVLSGNTMKKTLTDIGFNRPSGRVIGFSFLLGVLFYILNIFVASLAAFVLIMLGYRFPGGSSAFVGAVGFLIGIIIIGVLPGVCEEVSNRGILMRGLMSKIGVWRAVLLSSLIFGLMHLNIVQMFYAAVLGGFMALAILATRSLWTGIIIHFMNNALSVFFEFARSQNWAVGDFLNILIDFFGSFGGIIFFLLPVVMYLLIVRIIHMFARESYKANEKEYFVEFLKKNPEYIAKKVAQGQPVSIEEMSASVQAHTSKLSKMNAIRFYIEGQRKQQKLEPLEKTLMFGIIFLTSVVTAMTLVWGLPPFF